jgi:SAM-dependent methyltransferase
VYNEHSTHYETFYADGGWKYSFWREWWWHRRHFIRRFGIPRRARVLEAACGTGFHTNLLNRMGLDCIGVDRSETGIRWAREKHPQWRYILGDVRDDLPLEPESFDVVFTRGCGVYHYDLLDTPATRTTTELFRYLRPGGLFVLIVISNLSGRKEPDAIWQNTLEDYRSHVRAFSPRHTVDWHEGVAIAAAWKPFDPQNGDADVETPSTLEVSAVGVPGTQP